jgi:hypothetical protein
MRGEETAVEYRGLGDDPAKFEVREKERPLRVVDDQMDQVRMARDHRKLVIQKWIEQKKLKPPRPGPAKNEAVARVLADRREKKHHDKRYVKTMLKTLVKGLAVLDPFTAAVVLFGEGVVGIHHAWRMHRVAHGARDEHATRAVLEEIQGKIEALPSGQAKVLIDKLLAEYGH